MEIAILKMADQILGIFCPIFNDYGFTINQKQSKSLHNNITSLLSHVEVHYCMCHLKTYMYCKTVYWNYAMKL